MHLILEREATERLHLPEHTLQRLRRLKQGPAWVRLGRRIFYTPEALDAWVLASTHAPQTQNDQPANEEANHA